MGKKMEAKNIRRIQLIHRKFDGGLSGEEEQELDRLDKEVGDFIDARCPMPDLSHLRKLVEGMDEVAKQVSEACEELAKEQE